LHASRLQEEACKNENGPIANTQEALFNTEGFGSSLSNQSEDVVMAEEFSQN
jgi:hypothetical protein